MTKAQRIPVEPSVIEWARTSAGFSVVDAAKALGVSDGTLLRWETGEINPTIGQLRKMSERYRRPLGVLLLSEPPRDFEPLRDFRKRTIARGFSPKAIAEFRRAEAQRAAFLEIGEATREDLPAGVPPRIQMSEDVESAASRLRTWLVEGASPPRGTDSYQYLNFWIRSLENRGVLVVHTRNVPVSELRGFSIGEFPNPVIGLNGKDAVRARVFTLIHEVAHLALNAAGVCDLHDQRRLVADVDRVEHYCNGIAGSVLMPKEVISLEASRVMDAHSTIGVDELSQLSQRLGPSSESILIRLITLGMAGWSDFDRIKPELARRYEEAEAAEQERRRASKSGPTFYVVKARDLGKMYVTTVADALSSESISSLDAVNYLGVRFDQIPRLVQEAGS